MFDICNTPNILSDISFGGWFHRKAKRAKFQGTWLGWRILQIVFTYSFGLWVGILLIVLLSPIFFVIWLCGKRARL